MSSDRNSNNSKLDQKKQKYQQIVHRVGHKKESKYIHRKRKLMLVLVLLVVLPEVQIQRPPQLLLNGAMKVQ